MNPPSLRVLVVASEADDARFVRNVLEDNGDDVRVSDDVTDALGHLTRVTVDVAFVALSLPRGDGLALVHHIRALYPAVDVIVMSAPSEMEETAHAIALGVLQQVPTPLTGDAILVAADRARERRVLIADRARLAKERSISERRTATYARCASFVAEIDARAVAERILEACVGEVPVDGAALYAPAHLGQVELEQITSQGDVHQLPTRLDEDALLTIDPTMPVQELDDEVRLNLLGDSDVAAVIILRPTNALNDHARASLAIVGALGTAAYAAARKVDAIARAGIKDPDTSAYTFAYFGDVAARELDRASRHNRRFALLTLRFEGILELRSLLGADAFGQVRRTLTDSILDAVRDSDVLARVEDAEYYLLLPESGRLGASATRERILRLTEERLASGGDPVEPAVGIAVYPTDGRDLGRLLRVGRRRAEAGKLGVAPRLKLHRLDLWPAVEALVGREDDHIVPSEGRLSLPPGLKDAADGDGSSGHAALPLALVERIITELLTDAQNRRLAGTVYVSGPPRVLEAAARAPRHGGNGLRLWLLGPHADPRDPASLSVADPALGERTLVLAQTSLGAFALIARPLGEGDVHFAYQSSDVDVVSAMISRLEDAYHLQPEVIE